MIRLAQLLRHYQTDLTQRYQNVMQPRHTQAMQAIIDCHTPACGEISYTCAPCHQQETFCHSCGNRSCPACQHQANNQWLERQRQKLLPVEYYLITFTLPAQLRGLVWHHQQWAYHMLFEVAVSTLNSFAKKDAKLGDTLGMTGVLHTHSRQLAFHPHVHFVIPGGGLDRKRSQWRPKPGKYLFNGKALAKVFRARCLDALAKQGFRLPPSTPKDWVVQCQHVGQGEAALTYLARYLYRGVISEQNILKHEQGQVTFQYQDSQTRQWQTRTEPALKFLWLVLQHVLPKGFRRARDYGFLHGNAKKTLQRLQLILRVRVPVKVPILRKVRHCPCCGLVMLMLQFIRRRPGHLAESG